MYGDTHVQPQRLFDPLTGQPPADTVELYFPAPMSLCLFGDAVHDNPDPHWSRQWPELAELFASVADDTVIRTQRACGYVEHPARGPATAATLELAMLVHNSVPGDPIMRLHLHLYVGRTAATIADGSRRPVNLRRLRRGLDGVWTSYRRDLEDRTAHDFGFTWAPLPGHHPADTEIVNPPFAEHVGRHQPPHVALCPGPFGRLERILADERWRHDMIESQRRVDAERRAG